MSNKIFSAWGAGGISHNINLKERWYHVVITHKIDVVNNKYKFNFYVDGSHIGVINTDIPYSTSYGPDSALTIGKYWKGLIDEVLVFNESLSSSQIKQNYIAGLNSMFANGNISKQEYNERINNLSIK
ncbi:MAG: hypothetical protein PHU74_00915 [Candidatus Pacebacteria bacterium]|nr:hypothetical protein [Candidatus Paceibacterota bacterium]